MKKIVKILSSVALASLFIGGTATLSSCNNGSSQIAESLANLIEISESGTKIDSNFSVPAYAGSGDDKTEIEWISNDESLLTFERDKDSDGNDADTYTAVVHRPASNTQKEYTEVTFYAVVKNGKKSAQSTEFNVRIRREVTAQEYYEEWISTMGVTHNFGGYVIAKVGYTTQYKECNLILWDTEVKAAYLVYQGYMDQEVYNNLELGTYVSVKGATNQLYNGLVETKYGATLTADATNKIDVSTIERTSITEAIIKNTLVNAKNSATEQGLKLQNSYVSLEGFTIKSISESYSKTSGTNGTTYQTLATLTRYGQDIDVVIAEGITPFASSIEVYNAVKALKEGTQVSIKGILGWNNKPVIILTSKDDISKVAKDYTDAYVDYDKSYAAAETVSSKVKSIYFSSADVELPATDENGATLTYSVSGECLAYDDTTHKLAITAAEASKKGKLTITAKSGEISYTKTVSITAQLLTDQQFADKVANELKLDSEVSTPSALELAVKDTYGMEATIAWKVIDGGDVATVTDKGYLEVIPGTKDSTVKVKAVVTYNEKTAEKEFTISVKKIEVSSIEDVSKAEYDSTKESWYCVEGYVTSTYGSYGGCYIDVAFEGQKKTFCVFKPTDLYGNLATAKNYAGKTFVVGSKIKVYGLLSQYNKINQFSTSYILDVQEPDDTAKAIINLNSAKESFKSVYYATATVTLPEGVSATVKSGTSVTIDGQKVTIAATTEKVENVITLTSVSGGVTKTAEVTFSTEEYVIPSGEQTLKLEYTGTDISTKDSKKDVNYGANFDLPENLFTIKLATDGKLGLYNKSIRLYAYKASDAITISSTNVMIKSIKVTYDTSKTGGTLSVLSTADGATAKQGTKVDSKSTSESFEINASGVKLYCDAQTRLASIEIVYQKAE